MDNRLKLSPALGENSRALGIDLTPEALDRFEIYLNELIEANRVTNLTAIREPVEIEIKHFADSLAPLLRIREDLAGRPSGVPLRVIDVGTGAGFPGLPLKIVDPTIELTLLEATRKKTDFLQRLVERLGLTGVQVVNLRAEEAGQDVRYREQFDLALSRAVAEMAVLCELCLPFLRPPTEPNAESRTGSLMIAQKNARISDEVRASNRAMYILGGQLRRRTEYTLPGIEEPRWLIAVEKVAPTPGEYPRRSGIPAKKPI